LVIIGVKKVNYIDQSPQSLPTTEDTSEITTEDTSEITALRQFAQKAGSNRITNGI
jgi:hypothetical protein